MKCYRCYQDLDESEFYADWTRRSEERKKQSLCKVCQHQVKRIWRQSRPYASTWYDNGWNHEIDYFTLHDLIEDACKRLGLPRVQIVIGKRDASLKMSPHNFYYEPKSDYWKRLFENKSTPNPIANTITIPYHRDD